MVKFVIFDMDGTIADTEPFHEISRNKMLEKLNIPLEYSPQAIGKSKTAFFKEMFEKFDIHEDAKKMCDVEFDVLMEEIKGSNLKAEDGLKDLLEYLKQNKIRMAVASSSPYKYLDFMVKHLGIDQYFETLVGSDMTENAKPYPDVYLKAMEVMKVNPKDGYAVEDTKTGARAGIAAGLKVIGYDNVSEIQFKQDLSICSFIVHNMREIIKLI